MSIENKKKSFLNLVVLLVPHIGSSSKSLFHQENLVGPSIRSFLFEPRLKAINLTAVYKLFLEKIELFKQHEKKLKTFHFHQIRLVHSLIQINRC